LKQKSKTLLFKFLKQDPKQIENILSAKKLKTQKSVKLKRDEQQLRQFISKKIIVRLKRRKRDLRKVKKTNRKLIMLFPKKRMTFSNEKKKQNADTDNLFVFKIYSK
jgi:hypothetical protein